MPSFRHTSFGNSATPWNDIVSYFNNLIENNTAFLPMVEFVNQLALSDYVKEGLYGNISIHKLRVSQTKDVTGNPYLLIEWDVRKRLFQFTFEDGSTKPWVKTCLPTEAIYNFERFLIKRARWFCLK